MKKVMRILRGVLFGALMLAILVCQFIPFWSGGTPVADQSSLIGITGRQYVHENLIEIIHVASGGFAYQDISTSVLLTVCFAAVGIFAAIKNSSGVFKFIVGAVVSGCGIYLWLKVPAYTLGSVGNIIFVFDLLLAVLSVYELVSYILESVAHAKEKKN